MPPKIHAGATLDRAPGSKYARLLRFAEISLRAPFPKPSTMARWRAELPEDFVLAIVAPKEALSSAKGPLRMDETMQTHMRWLREVAKATRARFIVLPTRGDLTTGQRDRELLTQYIEAMRGEYEIVWAPGGLWEPETAEAFAKKLGVIYGFDAIETPSPANKTLYARLVAMGFRSKFSDANLELVLANLHDGEAEEAFVAIESNASYREASRLESLSREFAGLGDEEEDEDDLDEDSDEDEDDLDEDSDEDEDDLDEDSDEDEDDEDDEDEEDDDE